MKRFLSSVLVLSIGLIMTSAQTCVNVTGRRGFNSVVNGLWFEQPGTLRGQKVYRASHVSRAFLYWWASGKWYIGTNTSSRRVYAYCPKADVFSCSGQFRVWNRKQWHKDANVVVRECSACKSAWRKYSNRGLRAGLKNGRFIAGTPNSCHLQCCLLPWCKSFNFYKARNLCFIMNITRKDGPLLTYSGNPYDHYTVYSGTLRPTTRRPTTRRPTTRQPTAAGATGMPTQGTTSTPRPTSKPTDSLVKCPAGQYLASDNGCRICARGKTSCAGAVSSYACYEAAKGCVDSIPDTAGTYYTFCKGRSCIPGVVAVGAGFDARTGARKSAIVNFHFEGKDFVSGGRTYDIPEELAVTIPSTRSTISSDVEEYSSTRKYRGRAGAALGIPTKLADIGAMASNLWTKRTKRQMQTTQSRQYSAKRETLVWQLRLEDPYEWDNDFNRTVQGLPARYDYQAYKRVIENCGTHLVREVKIGGALTVSSSFAACSTTTTEKVSSQFLDLAETVLAFKTKKAPKRPSIGGSSQQDETTTVTRKLEERMESHVVGGLPESSLCCLSDSTGVDLYTSWKTTVVGNPAVVGQEVRSIAEEIRAKGNATIAAHFETAMNAYIAEGLSEDSDFTLPDCSAGCRIGCSVVALFLVVVGAWW